MKAVLLVINGQGIEACLMKHLDNCADPAHNSRTNLLRLGFPGSSLRGLALLEFGSDFGSSIEDGILAGVTRGSGLGTLNLTKWGVHGFASASARISWSGRLKPRSRSLVEASVLRRGHAAMEYKPPA